MMLDIACAFAFRIVPLQGECGFMQREGCRLVGSVPGAFGVAFIECQLHSAREGELATGYFSRNRTTSVCITGFNP